MRPYIIMKGISDGIIDRDHLPELTGEDPEDDGTLRLER